MTRTISYIFLFSFALSLSAQDWCKNRSPAKLDRDPLTFENKLISDRFSHTINPDILNYRTTQIEIASVLSPEFYTNNSWTKSDTMSIYSIYNSYTIKHTFRKDLELQLSYTDLIIKADERIKEYGKKSLNTDISIGAKYFINYSRIKTSKLTLFAQVTIPKFQNTLNTLLSPEIRILYSHPFGKHLILTYNLGGVYIDDLQGLKLLYAINAKRPIGKRFEIFSEFYKSYTKTGPARSPSKRWLIGFGFYFLDNLYCYSSFEGGWYDEDSLNDGRIDFGLSYRIDRN
jgi:hypothetical protein